MSKVLIEEQTLYDIGDAIREKNGSIITYKPDEMPNAILDLQAGSELPNGYTKVDYITFTGDTGFYSEIITNNDFGFYAIFSLDKNNCYQNIIGGTSFDRSTYNYLCFTTASNNKRMNLIANNTANNTVTIGYIRPEGVTSMPTGLRYGVFAKSANGVIDTVGIEGTDYNFASSGQLFYSGVPIGVGCFMDIDESGEPSIRLVDMLYGRMYGLAFFDGNEMISKFVPCINSQNVAGMYDMVRDKFYSSETGTDFAYGNHY